MVPTKNEAKTDDAASRQPPRSDAPAGAHLEPDGEEGASITSPGSPAAPVMKQFARTEAESGDKQRQ